MTLRQKQSLFAVHIAQLILYAQQLGYDVTLGDAYRSPEEAARLAAAGKGIATSLHCQRLALDLNLFKDGRYLKGTDAHRPIGEHWETMHELARWGGRFQSPDGNHYSFAHGGRA